ncbi:MAG: choice-of-anchor J domain-containing protein [Cyclobacteriaceae bacterium]
MQQISKYGLVRFFPLRYLFLLGSMFTLTSNGMEVKGFREDFNNSCPAGLPPGWTAINSLGEQTWNCSAFGRTNTNPEGSAPHGLQINGFDGFSHLNEDWLISPAFDLREFNFPLLSFWSRMAFSGPRLKLMVSVDYVQGNPHAANWIQLGDRFAQEDTWAYSGEINLDSFKAESVRIAFLYQSSPEHNAARWTIDDFVLNNAEVAPSPYLHTTFKKADYLHFGTQGVDQPSSAKTFGFSLQDGSKDLNILGPDGFQFSKDSLQYFPGLSYSPKEAASENKVFIRFRPRSEGAFSGPLLFKYGDNSEMKSFLSGSTVAGKMTLDVVTWNLEWFGSSVPFQGPQNVNLQLENVKKVILDLNADIYAFQEITDTVLFHYLIDDLPGYKARLSPATSGGPDQYKSAQKLAFVYKTATMVPISQRVLFKDLDLNALKNYPSETGRFWASGRLPYLMEFMAKINGNEKEITLINVHTRSNGGGESASNPRYAMRKYDVSVLKDSLDLYYAQVPLILLGDFNDDLDETVADQTASTVGTAETSFIRFMEDIENYHPATLALSLAGLRTYLANDHVIDHMVLSDELKVAYLNHSSRIVTPFDLITNYQNTTSDHFPVKIRLNLEKWNWTDPLLGLPKQHPEPAIKVYPNPANKLVQVYMNNKKGIFQVELKNVQGQILQNILSENGRVKLDVSALPKGVYFLQVTPSTGRMMFQRLVIR